MSIKTRYIPSSTGKKGRFEVTRGGCRGGTALAGTLTVTRASRCSPTRAYTYICIYIQAALAGGENYPHCAITQSRICCCDPVERDIYRGGVKAVSRLVCFSFSLLFVGV